MEVKLIMSYRQIEAFREARLWVTQVIVPTLLLAGTVVMVDPELKEAVKTKAKNVKTKIVSNLQK